jgi:hypothetical protein
MAEHLGDQRQQPSFEDALGEFIGGGEHRGARDQRERLGALEPVRVLRFQVLALHQDLLQDPWPH